MRYNDWQLDFRASHDMGRMWGDRQVVGEAAEARRRVSVPQKSRAPSSSARLRLSSAALGTLLQSLQAALPRSQMTYRTCQVAKLT